MKRYVIAAADRPPRVAAGPRRSWTASQLDEMGAVGAGENISFDSLPNGKVGSERCTGKLGWCGRVPADSNFASTSCPVQMPAATANDAVAASGTAVRPASSCATAMLPPLPARLPPGASTAECALRTNQMVVRRKKQKQLQEQTRSRRSRPLRALRRAHAVPAWHADVLQACTLPPGWTCCVSQRQHPGRLYYRKHYADGSVFEQWERPTE